MCCFSLHSLCLTSVSCVCVCVSMECFCDVYSNPARLNMSVYSKQTCHLAPSVCSSLPTFCFSDLSLTSSFIFPLARREVEVWECSSFCFSTCSASDLLKDSVTSKLSNGKTTLHTENTSNQIYIYTNILTFSSGWMQGISTTVYAIVKVFSVYTFLLLLFLSLRFVLTVVHHHMFASFCHFIIFYFFNHKLVIWLLGRDISQFHTSCRGSQHNNTQPRFPTL